MCNNYDWTMLPLCFMFCCEFSAFSCLKTTKKHLKNANFLRYFYIISKYLRFYLRIPIIISIFASRETEGRL